MENYVNEICDICKLPLQEIGNKFKIIQIGENVIYISNYIKLIDYGNEKIVLKVKNNILEISGKYLKINQLNKNEIIISGIIFSSVLGVQGENKK